MGAGASPGSRPQDDEIEAAVASHADCVCMGTSSWTDASLLSCGWYPQGAKKGKSEEKLAYYASQLPCVEVDMSAYAFPTRERLRKWSSKVGKRFVLHFKAFNLFTQLRVPYAMLPNVVREMFPKPDPAVDDVTLVEVPDLVVASMFNYMNQNLEELHDSGRLGHVLFQFPPNFVFSEVNKAWVSKCRALMDPRYRMAVEFRHTSWFMDLDETNAVKAARKKKQPLPQTSEALGQRFAGVADWLAAEAITWVCQDEYQDRWAKPSAGNPLPLRLVPLVMRATTNHFYIRVHRREGEHRNLTDVELEHWASRLYRLLHANPHLERIYLIWNTNYKDQSMQNIKALQALLDDRLCLDWRTVYVEAKKKDKGSIFSFFKVAPKRLPQDPPVQRDAEHRDNEEDESSTPEMSPKQPAKRPKKGTIDAFFGK